VLGNEPRHAIGFRPRITEQILEIYGCHPNTTPLDLNLPCEAKVALAAVKGDRTLAQLAEQFDIHPNQITSWKAQLEGGASDVFGPGGGNGAAQPAVDVKSLHAKIGELTLENDFLEGALTKAGLLSAKR
jgi:transposase